MATSMELKSISCKGVKSQVPFPKPSLYAVIFISDTDNLPNQKQKKKTALDRVGGENPDWDQPIRLDLNHLHPDLLLEFNIKAEGIFGNRLIGKVRIPFTNFDFTGAVCHVSYQVRTPDGKPNGVLNFSYTIDGKPNGNHPLPSIPAAPVSYTPSAPPVDYYTSVSVPDRPASYPPTPPGVGYYPSVAIPDPVVSYPQGYYPSVAIPDPVASYPQGYYPPPPMDQAVSLYPPVSAVGGYYPSPPPAYESYPPPPAPACCYPGPACCYPAPEQYGYLPNYCDQLFTDPTERNLIEEQGRNWGRRQWW